MTNLKESSEISRADLDSMEQRKIEQYLPKYYEWFDSDDGELIKEAFDIPGIGSFSDIRRTVYEDGAVRTRYTLTLPDGTKQRIIGLGGRECHSPVGGAAVGDNCGCDSCEEWIRTKATFN